MSAQQIVEHLAALEAIIEKNDGFVTEEAARIRMDLNVPSAEELAEQLESLSEQKRLLSIGIIGRVKAGKSSLLNSVLFDGQDVLPKAATPMTASLAIVTYGPRFAVSVEYFTPEDIQKIAREHKCYCDTHALKVKEITQEMSERRARQSSSDRSSSSPEEAAARSATRELRDHHCAASFDQYERMKRSGKLAEMNNRHAPDDHITADDLEALQGKLARYVGSDGELTPFTKSIRIELPMESLQGIQVIDTPGVNDPVISREQRTQDFLKKCDVVLIVSPAGQFLTREDTDLMDRVTAREGVREMYLVAAQADTQLHGDVFERVGGNLHDALALVRGDLSRQANLVLSTLKASNPEVGSAFDQLIEGGEERLILTSSISHAISRRFDAPDTWDEGMQHHWEMFKDNYPDYFSNSTSGLEALTLLANISSVTSGINAARKSRDAIIDKKRGDYINGQHSAVTDFTERLVHAINNHAEVVKRTDLAEIVDQKLRVESIVEVGGDAVDDAFEESLDDFKANLRDAIQASTKRLFSDAKSESQDYVTTTSEVRTGKREKSGATSWLARKLWGGGYEQYSYTEETTTIRSSAVKSLINKLSEDLQEELSSSTAEARQKWKRNVQTKVVTQLQTATDEADQLFPMIKRALRTSVNSMELPEVNVDLHFESQHSGVLKDGDAESFMEEVNHYLDRLRRHCRTESTKFVDEMIKAASATKLSELIFSDMRRQLNELQQNVADKHLTLQRLQRCHDEIVAICR